MEAIVGRAAPRRAAPCRCHGRALACDTAAGRRRLLEQKDSFRTEDARSVANQEPNTLLAETLARLEKKLDVKYVAVRKSQRAAGLSGVRNLKACVA